MAGLFDKQAGIYADARPKYPPHWFSMLSAHTPNHSLAWDVGTGNGQAALGLAEHYDQVIATDISEEQLKHAISHPKVKYFHTPSSMSDEEIVALFGGENSVDLVTVAVAVHWFDLDQFYNLVKRLLKPGGMIAVWTYNTFSINPEFDILSKTYRERTTPFQHPKLQCALDCYRTLPFPFESVGLGREGEPVKLEMPKEMSFEGFLRLLKTWSAYNTAEEQGVDLLPEEVVKELESAWGGSDLVRTVIYITYMLAGKVKD